MTVTIYHNPACGTSRSALALIRNSGEEPRVIEVSKEDGEAVVDAGGRRIASPAP